MGVVPVFSRFTSRSLAIVSERHRRARARCSGADVEALGETVRKRNDMVLTYRPRLRFRVSEGLNNLLLVGIDIDAFIRIERGGGI